MDANAVFRPLPDDESPDIAGYNAELKQRGNPHWFDVSWLFSECYLYRSALPSSTTSSPTADTKSGESPPYSPSQPTGSPTMSSPCKR